MAGVQRKSEERFKCNLSRRRVLSPCEVYHKDVNCVTKTRTEGGDLAGDVPLPAVNDPVPDDFGDGVPLRLFPVDSNSQRHAPLT